MLKNDLLQLTALLALAGLGTVSLAQDDSEWLQRGAEKLAPYKQLLKEALKNGLQQGPEVAVTACNVLAPALTRNLTTGTVELGRASHKPRNPGNSLQSWMEAVSAGYQSGSLGGAQVGALEDGSTGYLELIYMQENCMLCHGGDIPADVGARLDALYPDDQARNFRVGDYRGLFWVKFLPSRQVIE